MKDSQSILQLFTLIQMISMFLTVANRTSSAVDSLQVDALNKQAIVTFKNGSTYAYGNVSTRAIINVLFNPDVSLGFWVNNNLVQSERVSILNGDEFDYSLTTKRERLNKLIKENSPELPQFA